jgi:hypothetical protein
MTVIRMGNIGREAPEIEVLPTEQPVPARREQVPPVAPSPDPVPLPSEEPEPVPV